ncbi:MAG: GHKL domain-containing protein [Lachnospiraceae bacterium]|nr:GHKL domain-containing protein [Lachnospiraceae bacterium]
MTEQIILQLLGPTLDLSSLILYFYIFMKKRKQYIPIAFVILSFFFSEIFIMFITIILSSNISLLAGIIRFIISISSTFLLTLFFESTFTQRIFFAFSFHAIYALSEFIAQFIVINYMDFSKESLLKLSGSISFLTNPLAFFFIILFSILLKNKKMYFSMRFSVMLLIAPIITTFAAFNRTVLEATSENQLSFALLIFGFLIINYVNYILLVISAKTYAEKEKNQYLLQQNEFQKDKYNQLSSAYKKLRKYQHDTKKRFMYIQECVNSEKYDAIIPYLDNSLDELNNSYSRINTGNLVIDSFVSNYMFISEENGIHFYSDLKIDSALIPIYDYNLSLIIGNLLDNSINACNQIEKDEEKYIKLYIQTNTDSEQFIIHIINSKPNQKISTKSNELFHGYGLINVKDHIDKFFGIMNINESENEFEISVIIPLLKKA